MILNIKSNLRNSPFPRRRRLAAALMATTLGFGTLAPLFAAEPPPATSPAAEPAPTPDGAPGPTATMRERMREHMEARRAVIDRHLTADQIHDIVAGRLAGSGNPNLKAGKVTAKADNIVAVDIVTKTGALVTTREISTKTGGPAHLEQVRPMPGGPPGGPIPGMRGEMMHGEMMHGEMMHGGMMPPGARPDRGQAFALGVDGPRDLKLTADQAKKLAEARLIVLGNPHLKVGAVKEKDADTIAVDVVASDNSLVVQREIDRHSGRIKGDRG